MARLLAALLLLALLLPGAAAAAQGPQRVLMSLDAPLADLAGPLARVGVRVLEDFPAAGVVLAEVPPARLAALRALPGVAGVHEEERINLQLSSSRPAVRVSQALWDAGFDGTGVAVAVVDSGIDERHPGMAGRVARSVRVEPGGVQASSGDADGHGTHIAGIIGGDGAASPGRRNAGMAPGASLVAVDISTSFTTTNAVRAFQWLHDHARELGLRVVCNSWGREKEGAAYDPDDPVIRASDALVREGIVVVFSAGNRGPGPGTLTVEAQNPNVLTVGATNDEGRVEAYSSRGPPRLADGSAADWPKPDVTAPGTAIVSARAGAAQGGEAYVALNGTSMAAPHVAGIAALMLEANPALTPAQVKDILQRTARDRGAPGQDPDNGAGFADGYRAVLTAQELAGTAPPTREAFRGQGDLGPAAPGLPLAVPRAGEVRQPILVPPGAVGLELALRWDDARTAMAATLEKGGRALGPFTATSRDGAWQELRLRVTEPLEAGTWTLVAKPRNPTLGAKYEVEGAVLVRHSIPLAPPDPPPAQGLFPALLSDPAPVAGPPGAALLMVPLAALGAWQWRRARLRRGA